MHPETLMVCFILLFLSLIVLYFTQMQPERTYPEGNYLRHNQ
jgi:hypothetical protein